MGDTMRELLAGTCLLFGLSQESGVSQLTRMNIRRDADFSLDVIVEVICLAMAYNIRCFLAQDGEQD